MLALIASAVFLAAVVWNFSIERRAARSRALYLAAVQASAEQSATTLQRLDTSIEILTAMRAEDEAQAAPVARTCDCDACKEREVARETLSALGPMAHRIVVVPPDAPHAPLGFAVIRWRQA